MAVQYAQIKQVAEWHFEVTMKAAQAKIDRDKPTYLRAMDMGLSALMCLVLAMNDNVEWGEEVLQKSVAGVQLFMVKVLIVKIQDKEEVNEDTIEKMMDKLFSEALKDGKDRKDL